MVLARRQARRPSRPRRVPFVGQDSTPTSLTPIPRMDRFINVMQRFLSPWGVRLTPGVTLLYTAVACLLADSCLGQSPHTTSALTQSQSRSSEGLYREASSVSQELSLQNKRRSRQLLALVHACDSLALAPQREARPRSVPVLSPLALVLFSPRKLPSPVAEDDPSLV